jgi:CheY-like chemotaxis protein
MNPGAPKKISVLIADDTEQDRQLLREAIAGHGTRFEIVGEVTDGAQLIEYLSGKGKYADRARHPFPALLFLDLRMPGMDGFAVLEWLQRHRVPRLKIAVLTDSSGIAYRAEALSQGADYFFAKHSGMAELAEILGQLERETAGGE